MSGRKGDIGFLFDPATVAVVGASPEPGKLSAIVLESLRASGFKGRIIPVNPRHRTVAGLECYPSLSDIDGGVDLAVLAVPAKAAVRALSGARGMVRGAIVIGGGFSEAGDEGVELERELRDEIRRSGVRVIGPNCMGIFDATTGLDTFFLPRDRVGRPGPGAVSIVSQSGSFAVTAVDELATEGIGVARVVSYGNKADVNESDCLEFLARDPATKAVLLYIEAIEDGRRFVQAASECSAKKPVLAVKVGRQGAGAAAALSHTGALAGRHEIYRAAFRKAGVIELAGYEDFIVACKAYGTSSPAKGPRVMIITDGGGMGVGMADACIDAGLDVAALPEEVEEEIRGSFPPYFTISNPLDLTGSATDEMFAEALERTLEGGHYDMAIVAALWGPPALTDDLARIIGERARLSKKPVVVCSPGGEFTRGKAGLFRAEGLAVFTTPESAVRAASVLAGGPARLKAKAGG